MNVHRKGSYVDAYAVMTVFGRGVLQMSGCTLGQEANPLDSNGQVLDRPYLDALCGRAGEGFLGLLSLRQNILRSIQISMAVLEVRDRVDGDPETDPVLKKIAREMCTTITQVLKALNLIAPGFFIGKSSYGTAKAMMAVRLVRPSPRARFSWRCYAVWHLPESVASRTGPRQGRQHFLFRTSLPIPHLRVRYVR